MIGASQSLRRAVPHQYETQLKIMARIKKKGRKTIALDMAYAEVR
jgi:hypothetical protein